MFTFNLFTGLWSTPHPIINWPDTPTSAMVNREPLNPEPTILVQAKTYQLAA